MSESVTPKGRLAINWAEFERLCNERGWVTMRRRAAELGVSYQQLDHLRVRRAGLGAETIDALITAFGSDSYTALVEREPVSV